MIIAMIIGSKFSVIIGSIFLVYCEISYLRKRDIKVKTPSVSKLTKTTSNQKVVQIKMFLDFFTQELTIDVRISSKLYYFWKCTIIVYILQF